MARVEVDADVRSARRPQLQRRLDVVDDEAGMRLERHLHAVLGREAPGLAPVRNRLLLPLPLEDVEEFRRPWRRDPVRMLRIVGVAGTAGEGDDDGNVEAFREADGLAKRVVVRLGGLL